MCTLPHQHAYANSAAVRAVPQRHRVGQAGTPRTELASLLAKVVTLAAGGSLALAAVAGCAPVSNSAAQNPPSEGDRVAVLITGTAHEPHPMLTAGALQGGAYCGGEHERHRDGPGGKSSSELVNYRRRPTLSGRGAHPRVEPTARSSTAAAFEADRRQLAAGCRHPW